MDTVKVDVRKLQLLNDRINQCLDALSQVRLSAHGLAHAAQAYNPYAQNPNAGAAGFGLQPGAGPVPGALGPQFQGPGIANPGMIPAQPFATPTGIGGGLGHSSFAPGPQPTPGATMGVPAGITAAGQQIPLWALQSGLAHASRELETDYSRPLWADPVLSNRVVQTFPYAQAPLSPVVSLA